MAWLIQRGNTWYVGWKEGTKDRYETTGSNDPEIAKRKKLEKELSLTIKSGPVAEPAPEMALDALIGLYKKEADLSPKTVRINDYSWGHFKRVCGDVPIGSISTESVKTFKQKLLQEGAAPATISIYLRDLNKLMGFALDKGLIRLNPCKKPGTRKWAIEHPEDELTWRFLTVEEEQKLLAVCNPILRPKVIVALNTGLRVSQVAEMDWKRFDPKTSLYHVPKQKRQKARHIPIFKEAREAMGMLKIQGRVFPETSQDQILGMFGRAVRKSGIGGDCTFHDLRHTYVSRMVKILSPVEVRDLMGWSSLAMVDRYTHSRVTDIQAKIAASM